MARQRLLRHIYLFSAAATLAAGFGMYMGSSTASLNISMGSAYASLAFFVVTLVYGPWLVLHGRNPGISNYWRRDVGIWTALLASVHVLFALQHHVGGQFIYYFLAPPDMVSRFPLRLDAFGVSNWIGLAITIEILMLLGLSSDRSMRWLGPKLWKRLQQTAYLLIFAIFLHGMVFHLKAERKLIFIVLFFGGIAAICVLQIAGLRRRRRGL